MFLRFLKLLARIFLVFTILTWAVLLPVNAVGVKSAFRGLGTLSWSK
jgi:calcium permeable stress-gated cation channel